MKCTLIGAGNMATALINGFIAQGLRFERLTIACPDLKALDPFANNPAITTTTDNVEAIEDASLILLAVKPNVCQTVCEQLAPHITPAQCLLSVAAGVTMASFAKWLGDQQPIIRCMPNTPALVGAGASALAANPHASNSHKTQAESLLQAVGTVVWVEEETQLDVVTALSGSGPAYFFLFFDHLVQAAVKRGLQEDCAKQLALQTAKGAALLASESPDSLSELRKKVTSKGGTTAAGLAQFEQHDFAQIVDDVIGAATLRAKELAQGG